MTALLLAPLRRRAARLWALVDDNPVLDKDAAVALRTKAAPILFAAVGVIAWLVAIVIHLDVEPNLDDLAQPWRMPAPSGREMLCGVAMALLVLESLLLPAVASSALAGERERGTLPLLQVSALSPSRVVAGKLLGILAAAAPALCAALPALALAGLYGGVDAGTVVVVAVLLAVHGAVLTAVGIGASAMVARSRVAAPLAMVFAAVPTVFAAFPAIAVFGSFADNKGEDFAAAVPVFLVGLSVELLVGVAALLLARDRLAPRSAERWPLRRPVVLALLAGLPVVAALALRASAALGALGSDVDDAGAAFVAVQVVVAMACAMLFELTVSARARSLRHLGLVVITAAAGIVAARAVLPGAFPGRPWSLLAHANDSGAAAVALVVVAGASVAFLAALASQLTALRPLRVFVVVAVLLGLFFLPVLLNELHMLFGWDSWPLAFVNPMLALDHHHARARDALAFYASLDVVALAFTAALSRLSRRRR